MVIEFWKKLSLVCVLVMGVGAYSAAASPTEDCLDAIENSEDHGAHIFRFLKRWVIPIHQGMIEHASKNTYGAEDRALLEEIRRGYRNCVMKRPDCTSQVRDHIARNFESARELQELKLAELTRTLPPPTFPAGWSLPDYLELQREYSTLYNRPALYGYVQVITSIVHKSENPPISEILLASNQPNGTFDSGLYMLRLTYKGDNGLERFEEIYTDVSSDDVEDRFIDEYVRNTTRNDCR